MANKIQKAIQLLEDNGYAVRFAWTTEDVQSKFHCTDKQAKDIIESAVTNEYIAEQINNEILSLGREMGLKEKEDEDGNND